MTLEEHYYAGVAEGERRGDRVLADGRGLFTYTDSILRGTATLALSNRVLGSAYETHAAYCLGMARGFRKIAR